MTDILPIRLPQINANDESATIVEWVKQNGDPIGQNETICIVETTKSVIDIVATAKGYLSIVVNVDERAKTGQIIAAVSNAPISQEDLRAWVSVQEAEPEAESKWTLKAELLAKRHGVELAEISSRTGKITEADVQHYLQSRTGQKPPKSDVSDLMDGPFRAGRSQRLLVIGGGNGAIQIADAVAKIPTQRIVGIVDDNTQIHGKQIAGIPILGSVNKETALEMLRSGTFDAAVISVSTSIDFRARIYKEWSDAGIPFANIIHPTVDLGANVAMGTGNVILSFCHLGPCATLGNNSFFSPYCSIEHHAVVGDHCSFGPAVVTSSSVQIGDQVRFGTGIFIEPHISIGSHCVISSGTIILENIEERTIVKSRVDYIKRKR